jgi:hypothetical protein
VVATNYSGEVGGSGALDLNSDTDVALWINSALKGALEQAGFRVYEANSAASASTPVVLTSEIKEARAESYTFGKLKGQCERHLGGLIVNPATCGMYFVTTGEGHISLRVELYQFGHVQIRHYSGSATEVLNERYALAWFPEEWDPMRDKAKYGSLLAAALTDLLRNAVPDLASAMDSGGPSKSQVSH